MDIENLISNSPIKRNIESLKLSTQSVMLHLSTSLSLNNISTCLVKHPNISDRRYKGIELDTREPVSTMPSQISFRIDGLYCQMSERKINIVKCSSNEDGIYRWSIIKEYLTMCKLENNYCYDGELYIKKVEPIMTNMMSSIDIKINLVMLKKVLCEMKKNNENIYCVNIPKKENLINIKITQNEMIGTILIWKKTSKMQITSKGCEHGFNIYNYFFDLIEDKVSDFVT